VEYTDFNFANQLHNSGNYEAKESKIRKNKHASMIWQPVNISCLKFLKSSFYLPTDDCQHLKRRIALIINQQMHLHINCSLLVLRFLSVNLDVDVIRF